jgi:hypothetical protein
VHAVGHWDTCANASILQLSQLTSELDFSTAPLYVLLPSVVKGAAL